MPSLIIYLIKSFPQFWYFNQVHMLSDLMFTSVDLCQNRLDCWWLTGVIVGVILLIAAVVIIILLVRVYAMQKPVPKVVRSLRQTFTGKHVTNENDLNAGLSPKADKLFAGKDNRLRVSSVNDWWRGIYFHAEFWRTEMRSRKCTEEDLIRVLRRVCLRSLVRWESQRWNGAVLISEFFDVTLSHS